MFRSLERRWAFDLAATLVVVLLAVSAADIDDYDMHSRAMHSPLKTSMSWNATAEISPATPDPESGPHDACACLLCLAALSDWFGARISPPPAGKQAPPLVARVSGSLHRPEVFHPPSA